MIKLNDNLIELFHFPDGTLKIDLPYTYDSTTTLRWVYEKEEELSAVAFIKMHLDDIAPNCKKILEIDYVPNGRMDRVKNNAEVFTLKHFAKFINFLNFDRVFIFDPHSHVSEALFDRVKVISPTEFILAAIEDIDNPDLVLFYPDEGAQKRYNTKELTKYPAFFGNKVREWETGHIKGLKVETHTDKTLDYLKGKSILIIDDIISAGGTVYHSIKELEKLGVEKVYVYCSHLENTMFTQEQNPLREMLEEQGILQRIYTTDSLFTMNHEHVKVL